MSNNAYECILFNKKPKNIFVKINIFVLKIIGLSPSKIFKYYMEYKDKNIGYKND